MRNAILPIHMSNVHVVRKCIFSDDFLVTTRETWAAAGFEDTELGVNMEPEVGHGNYSKYTARQVRLMLDAVRDFIESYPA